MKRLILAGACALLAGTPLLAEEPKIPTLAIGAKAPDFTLPGVDGKDHSLKDFADAKALAIVFTCNHCPTAQAYEGRLKALVDDYKAKGVAVVAISPNAAEGLRLDELGYTDLGDTFDDMKARAEHQKFNFPYLYEGDKTGIARAYGPTATPHAFLFDADRKLRYVGRIDDSERPDLVKSHDLRDAIDAVLAGREIAKPTTKVIGCSVKWKDKAGQVEEYMAKVAAEPVSVEPADAKALEALMKNDSDKLRLVNVWATSCGPCVAEFPELVEINRMYRNRDFELVTVAAQFPDEKDEVLSFLKKKQASCRNLLFAETDKYKQVEAIDKDWDASLPFTALVAPGGKVLYKVNGRIDPLALKRAIVDHLGRGLKGN